MIVDSSALVAMVTDEPEQATYARYVAGNRCAMSAATWFETALVLDSRSTDHGQAFDELIASAQIELRDVTPSQARIAREAHRQFGRGSGSRARLNFGDCFAYALAKETGEPLLFKGDDFTHTDVVPALSH